MKRLTIELSDQEYDEVAAHALGRGMKPAAHLKRLAVESARARKMHVEGHRYVPLEHRPIGETQHARNSHVEPGADK